MVEVKLRRKVTHPGTKHAEAMFAYFRCVEIVVYFVLTTKFNKNVLLVRMQSRLSMTCLHRYFCRSV